MLIRRMPDTLVIILCFMLLFTLLTWIVPAGSYDRAVEAGREVVVPGSYHRVDPAPQGLGSFLTAPIKGFISAAEIIAFVFLVGGSFGILTATGAITSGLQRIISWSQNRPAARKAIVPLLMVLFSLAGASFGMSEEVLVFILISIPLAEAMGYDVLVGVAIPFVGAGAGFAGAFSNPFTIGIAQGIVELPPFSGMGYRLIVWVVLTSAAIIYVMRYIKKLEKGEVKGLYTKSDMAAADATTPIPFTWARKIIILLFFAALALLVIGVSEWGWYIEEIAGLFIGLGLAAALVARLSMEEATAAFTHGARDMITAGLVIALSKGLLIIAQEGMILDTILYAVSSAVEDFPAAVSVEVMFLVQTFLNFFIPSGSGQAALTMPIMGPLSDLLGITRQTAVLAYQLGDGLSNLIIPTSGVTMGVLAIARIEYDRWFRWMGPLTHVWKLKYEARLEKI